MDLTALEANVTTWVETLSGLKVHWMRQKPKALQFPFIQAELLAIAGKGIDERLYTYDAVNDKNVLTMTGIRALTISLHFLSRNQELGKSARQYAENFRTQILRPSSLDFLYSSNLSFVEMLALADGDYVDESGRLLSKVTVDVGLELRSSLTDPVDLGDYIKKVTYHFGGYVLDEFGRVLVIDEQGNIAVTKDGPPITVPE